VDLPSRAQAKFRVFKEKQKQNKKVFIILLGLKDFHGFEGVREMSTFPLVPFAFVATFGLDQDIS